MTQLCNQLASPPKTEGMSMKSSSRGAAPVAAASPWSCWRTPRHHTIDNMPEKLRDRRPNADADCACGRACSPDACVTPAWSEVDVVVAATGDDKANLVISLLSKTEIRRPACRRTPEQLE